MTAVPSVPVPDLDTQRLSEIRRHHGDDRPCSMRNDECFLLAAVESAQARLVAVEAERDTLAHHLRWIQRALLDGNEIAAFSRCNSALSGEVK